MVCVLVLHSESRHEVQFGFFGTFAVPFRPLSQGLCEILMFFFLFHVGRSGDSPDLVFAFTSVALLTFPCSRCYVPAVPILCSHFLPVRTPIRHGIGVLTYNILKCLLAKVAFLYALIQ